MPRIPPDDCGDAGSQFVFSTANVQPRLAWGPPCADQGWLLRPLLRGDGCFIMAICFSLQPCERAN
ncbi:hypothetical protein D3C75_1209200 [compost metagenome]